MLIVPLAAHPKQMETPLPYFSTNRVTCERVVQWELVWSGKDENQGRLLEKVNVASFPL